MIVRFKIQIDKLNDKSMPRKGILLLINSKGTLKISGKFASAIKARSLKKSPFSSLNTKPTRKIKILEKSTSKRISRDALIEK